MRSLGLTVAPFALIAVANWAVITYIQSNHPWLWPQLRRHLLGPLDGFPLVRERLLWAIAIAFALDLVILRRRSALVRLSRLGRNERTDLAYAALSIFGLGAAIPALLTFGLTSVGPHLLRDWTADMPRISPELPQPVLQILFYTVVVDFLRYWWHRWMHESRILWKFHEVHHEATSFTIFTGTRQHPLEYVLAIPVVVGPLVLLGASGADVAWVIVIRSIVDLLQHSMIPLTYGWVGRWILYSPVGHRIHHSPLAEHWDTNYGDFMPIWDRLFGTWYGGERVNTVVGSPGQPSRGFARSVVEPFVAAASLVAQRARGTRAEVGLAG